MIQKLKDKKNINKIKIDENTFLYFINIKNITLDLMYSLSKARQEKINSYKYAINKKQSLGAGILLKEALKKYKIKEKNIILKTNEYGKPYIENYENIYFNISHSNDYSILVISNKEVGCDIEKIKRINKFVIGKCFSKNEQDYIKNSFNKESTFIQIWTIKESYLKALGCGLNKEMSELDFVNKNEIIQTYNNFKLKQYNLDDYYITIWY